MSDRIKQTTVWVQIETTKGRKLYSTRTIKPYADGSMSAISISVAASDLFIELERAVIPSEFTPVEINAN